MAMLTGSQRNAVMEQRDPTPNKAPGLSWAERVRMFLGRGGERTGNLLGVAIGGLFVCGLAFLLLNWIFSTPGAAAADPALVGTWYSASRERPLLEQPLNMPSLTFVLVLNQDGTYEHRESHGDKTSISRGRWWNTTDGKLHLRASRNILGVPWPGALTTYEYSVTNYRPIDPSPGAGVGLGRYRVPDPRPGRGLWLKPTQPSLMEGVRLLPTYERD